MERMTIPDVRVDEHTIRRSFIDAEKVKEHAMEFYWRLKAIEDAIADEESEEYDLDRLRELVQADRDGRCVVLPCKIGDKVYVIDGGGYRSGYKPYAREKEVKEISWKKDRSGKDLGFGIILSGGDCGTSARYKASNIGKTVFLKKEEEDKKALEMEEKRNG